MFIHDLCAAMEKAGVAYAVVGGYAVALHGAVRGTVDIDLALHWTLQNLKTVVEILKKMGLVSRLPVDAESVFRFKKEYVEKRNLIAWNFYDPRNPINQVDIIITYNLKNKSHTKTVHSASGKVRILALPDLIAMKKASGRPQDLEDVRALEQL